MPYREAFGEIVIAMSCTGDAELMLMTIGFGNPTPPTLANAESIKSAFVTYMTPTLQSQYKTQKVAMRYQDSPTEQTYIETTSAADAAGSGTSPLPSNCAIVIQKKTGLAGKKNRGRFFVPGINEGLVNALGDIDSGAVASLQTNVNAMYTAWNTVVDELVIHHNIPYVKGVPGTGGPDPSQIPTNITSLVVAPRIGTQRRRMATRSFPLG